MTPLGLVGLALLATAPGEFSTAHPSPSEESRGPLTASLTVTRSPGAGQEVILKVVLRNVGDQRESFRLERPGVEFFVKDARGGVVHASVPCLQGAPCDAGLAEFTTLGPGEGLEFVERWRPRGGCVAPGSYSVKAKLRAYPGRRPGGIGEVGGSVPFILLKDIRVQEGGTWGTCVRRASGPVPMRKGLHLGEAGKESGGPGCPGPPDVSA